MLETSTHIRKAYAVGANDGIVAEVVVHDVELDKGELGAVDHEEHVLVPERIEAVVAHRLGPLLGHVQRHAVHAHAHIRVGDVARALIGARQTLRADHLHVELTLARHGARVVRVEAERGPQQDVRLEHVAARAVVGEERVVQLHLHVHVLEVQRRCSHRHLVEVYTNSENYFFVTYNVNSCNSGHFFDLNLDEIYTNMCLFFNRSEKLKIYQGLKKVTRIKLFFFKTQTHFRLKISKSTHFTYGKFSEVIYPKIGHF